MNTIETHEGHHEVTLGSNRNFGLVFFVVCLLVGGYQWYHGNLEIMKIALIASVVFLVPALLFPKVLYPFNLLWFKFGNLLHKIVSPLIMGVMFFLIVTPLALLMRSLGKRPLELHPDKNKDSYWTIRETPELDPESFKRQF